MPLPGDDRAAAAFEQHRARLIRVAHGMLGSISEAEDVVQDAWVRLERTDTREVDDLGAWLTTTVGRLALDALGSARRRRESYVGEWLPEPLVEAPAEDPTLDDKVTTALLVVLERLSPAERAAFILHDVFDLSFDEVAEVVGRTPAAVRQLASRARRRVEEGRPRFPVSREEQERVAHAFATAWQLGDLDQLLSTLDPEVVLRSDGGGRVSAAGRPLFGAGRVARALLAFKRGAVLSGRQIRSNFADVNGAPGLVLAEDDRLSVVSLTVDRGRIVAVDIVRNPDKLRHVERPA
jgi:RNA polymerase sigma-70 factor (ECF subfamily)